MGMFDYINFECKCPKCGTLVKGFQSKDGPSCMVKLEPWTVNRFYSSCKVCNRWIEYVRLPQGDSGIDRIVNFVNEGYQAYTLLKTILDLDTITEDAKKEIKDLLNSSSFPQDSSWLNDYILLPEKNNE